MIEKYRYYLLSDVSVGKKEVEDFYFSHQDSLPPLPSRSNFSMLNFSFEPSEKTVASFFKEVSSYLDSLRLGLASFEDLVSRHSDDFSSLSSFGVIGFTEMGFLFPEYEKAAFSISPGDVVGPIKTAAGLHLIKLLDKKGEKIKTQHLLKTILPSEEDKKETIIKINDIYNSTNKDPLFLEEYINNPPFSLFGFSGNFEDFYYTGLPEEISSIIEKTDESTLLEPFVLSDGSIFLLYVYEKIKEQPLSLENSFEHVSSLALENKINKKINRWLVFAKKEIYINIFDNN